MSIEVRIPPVGESITSGVVSVWHKKSGEYVEAGGGEMTGHAVGDHIVVLDDQDLRHALTIDRCSVLAR